MPKSLAEIRRMHDEAARALAVSESEYKEAVASGDTDAIAAREKASAEALRKFEEVRRDLEENRAAASLAADLEEAERRESESAADGRADRDPRTRRALSTPLEARAQLQQLMQRDDFFAIAHNALMASVGRADLTDDADLLLRAQLVFTDNKGGSMQPTIPIGPVASLKFSGPMADPDTVSVFVPDDPGVRTPVPTVDYTGTDGSAKAEGAAHGAGTDVSFGEKDLNSVNFTSGFVTLSWNAFMSQSGLQSFVERQLMLAADRKRNTDLTTSAAMGFVPDATTGKTSGQKAKILLSDIAELIGALDVAYLQRPKCFMMAHQKIITHVGGQQIDPGTDDRFVLQAPPSMDMASEPQLVFGGLGGYKFRYNNAMESAITKASGLVLAFGDFGSFVYRSDTGQEGAPSGFMMSAIQDTTTSPGVGVAVFAIGAGILADAKAIQILKQSA